jgi:hypothetical protein
VNFTDIYGKALSSSAFFFGIGKWYRLANLFGFVCLFVCFLNKAAYIFTFKELGEKKQNPVTF